MSGSKKVFVTGTSAGFGFETVKALASRGHTVYATMRNVTGKNAAQSASLKKWAKENGQVIHVLELDVTDDTSVEKAVASALELGGVDVLINNAGVGTWGIDEGYSVDQAMRIFDANLFGAMRVNRALIPHFRKRGQGLIIYVSSGLGRIVLPFMASYTSSKFALEGYAQALSYELAPLGIETSIIEPGAYGTSFGQNSLQAKKDVTNDYGRTSEMFKAFSGQFEQMAKAGQLGNPEEVVWALVDEVEHVGVRPLRRPVGLDVSEPVGAINKTTDQIQDHLLTAFGMKG